MRKLEVYPAMLRSLYPVYYFSLIPYVCGFVMWMMVKNSGSGEGGQKQSRWRWTRVVGNGGGDNNGGGGGNAGWRQWWRKKKR